MGYSDASTKADLAAGLNGVQFGEDAPGVWRQSSQDLTVTAQITDTTMLHTYSYSKHKQYLLHIH